MSFTELLRNARSSRVAVLHKFLTSYDPNNTNRVYAFVEGEPDVTFYRLYVQKYAGGQRDVYIYNCEGKRNVYSAYGDIVSRYPIAVGYCFS